MGTLPDGSIVKRGENHPESQLAIIPFGTGGQTSCSDELQSMDGLGLCLPLHENRLEPKHKIFLSHSGAQKNFVKQLCKDIERYDRYPFFDILRTSLSIGCDFPKAIFKAIEQCQVAVVVLSEDFFSRTKWPMLELSALVKRKSHDPDLIIMPVFLDLTRKQCRERKNHDRWFSLWESWAIEDQRIVLHDWKVVFEKFDYINSVSLCNGDEVKCREDIVDVVCKEVPPETRHDDSHVQGRSRMCKIIDEKIGGMELSELYKVRVLGLYGVGGIGKSTACKTLCNHYCKEFDGRVCHVEFGVDKELDMLQKILKKLTDIKHEQIDKLNEDECKYRMKNIKNQKILLAMDNVFEAYEIVQRTKLILRAGFAKSSIVIVTARSLGELQNLNLKESECLEMPELTKDDAISLFVREVACDDSTSEALICLCVKRCYFRKGDGSTFHYHPLALRVLGAQLGSDPSQWLEKLKKIDVFNQYGEKPDDHPIFSILRRSFNILQDEDKLLFMDCALFAKYDADGTEDLPYDWLSMIHGKELQTRLNGLKQKSLIETWEEGALRIGIHDLWREFSVMETKVGDLKSALWIYEKSSASSGSYIRGPSLSSSVWMRAQRISLLWPYGRTWNMHFFNRCSNLRALHLEAVDLEGKVLDLNGLYNLKSLKILMYYECEVRGLGLLRQLCLLQWLGRMPSNVTFIAEIEGLTNLQVLNLSSNDHLANIQFPNLRNLRLLRRVSFCGLFEGVSVSYNSLSNLRQFRLVQCNSLRWYNVTGVLAKLENLQIRCCSSLEALPNLQAFKNLKQLVISKCNSIQALLGIGDLATLLELQISECPHLGEVPNLSQLTNLQHLQLWKCSLNRTMIELSEFIHLQVCWISINGIREHVDLHKLTKLRSIIVDGWSTQGSTGVDSLMNLESLSIRDCRSLHSLGGLSKVTRLCHIQLLDCEFKDVSCLKDLIGLVTISISGCNLLKRFPSMHKATRLETLEIIDCKNLQIWEGLKRKRATSSEAVGVDLYSSGTFSNLQQLTLWNVPITKLLELSNFPKLQDLDIFGCQSLVKLTSSVPLTKLKAFNVSDCINLITIPNLSGCKHLKYISVVGSRITLSKNEIQKLRDMCSIVNIDSGTASNSE